jgi:hypothetical protein
MKLKRIEFKDVAERIDKNYEFYNNRIVKNNEICELIGIMNFDDKVHQYVYAINNAFIELGLRHRFFNVYNQGWELKSKGKHIKPLQVQRNRKLRSTLRRTIRLYGKMALTAEGREKQLLEAQKSICEGQLQQFNAIMNLDISLTNDDRKAITE